MPEATIDTASPNTLNPDTPNPDTQNQGSNERAQTGSNPTTNATNSSQASSQGVVSYEDFVKASEQKIFIDRR